MSRQPKSRKRSTRSPFDARLTLCIGSGGVGKTTTAAALGVAAARRGSRCALITVDPARRLRSALGLGDLDATPQRLEVGASGVGDLFAMALDTKRTFDELIDRVAPSPAIAASILRNPLYDTLSNELGGSTEYMAMEKLYELMQGGYDQIIVDTPPGAHAEALLSAPSRIAALVNSGAAGILKTPANILSGNRVTRAAMQALLQALEGWVGRGLVRNLSDFAASFEPLLSGFAERAATIEATLRDGDTSIILVTTLAPRTILAGVALCNDFRDNGLTVQGVIANQVQASITARRSQRLRCAPELREKLVVNFQRTEERARRDAKTMAGVRAEIAPILATVPRLATPVSSLDQLIELARILGEEAAFD